MRRITTTFWALTAISAVAVAGIVAALGQPPGPQAAALFLLSAGVGSIAIGLAGRILYVLEHARTSRVPTGNDR